MDTKLICKNMVVNEVDLNTVTKKYRNPKMKNTVKYISMQEVPQDIYIFDKNMTWTLIKTHEDINGHCYCLKSGTI